MTHREQCLDFVAWYEASYLQAPTLDEIRTELEAHHDLNDAKVQALLVFLVNKGYLTESFDGEIRRYALVSPEEALS